MKKIIPKMNAGLMTAETAIMFLRKKLCLNCGRKLKKSYDAIAKKKTGYQWECSCSPGIRISIG